jgi:hypothetical protein
MEGPSELAVAGLLFVGLFLNWVTAAIGVGLAVLIRARLASLLLTLLIGALEGLVGSRLELLDIYLTRDGWASIDALTVITMALSAAACLAWWGIGRFGFALVRRLTSSR